MVLHAETARYSKKLWLFAQFFILILLYWIHSKCSVTAFTMNLFYPIRSVTVFINIYLKSCNFSWFLDIPNVFGHTIIYKSNFTTWIIWCKNLLSTKHEISFAFAAQYIES